MTYQNKSSFKLDIFNTVSLTLLFLLLILGAFFRFYNNPIFKVLVPASIAVFGLYYYAKGDYLKYFKIGLIVVLLGHNANQYFYILLTLALFNYRIFTPLKGTPAKYLYLMLFSGAISFVLSQANEINLLGFPFFLLSFFLPVIFFLLTYKFVDIRMREELLDFYKNVILVLAVSASIQLVLKGSTADGLTGGTTSAHTLGFHLGVAFMLIGSKVIKLSRINHVTLKEYVILSLTIPLMFFSDAKYLMGNMIFAITIIYVLFHTQKLVKPVLIGLVFLIAVNGLDFIRNNDVRLSTKATVDFSYLSFRFLSSAKFQLLLETINLPTNEPVVFLIGSGPGTFLSRAANSRAYDTMDKASSTGSGSGANVESNLPSFIQPHTSWVTRKYAVKYFQTNWFGTLYDYRSSLISLFWEFGVIGFSLFLMFFGMIIKKMNYLKERIPKFGSDALFLQSLIVFYFLNSVLAYYFEYPETQIVFWMFIGIFFNKSLFKSSNLITKNG